MTDENIFLRWAGKGEKRKLVVDVETVSNYLIDKNHFATIYGKKSEKVFRYDGEKWTEDGLNFIKVKVENLLGNKATNHIVNEVVGKVKRKTQKDGAIFENTDLNLIPLRNGTYNIEKKDLQESRPGNYFKFVIPIDYDPVARCPKWEKFLGEVLYPEDIPLMQEFFGFQLYRKYFIKKALIGEGEQHTGKTTLVEIDIGWIGEENVSGVPLQKVSGGNDFVKLSMKDKHLNVYDDLSFKDLSDGGNFKVVTGGGHISAEEKFGDFVNYINFSKQFFTCNKIPPVKDNDDMAYFGRWMVVKFDNPIPQKEQDPFIVRKILAEKSGILNWALEGLHRLLENKCFSYNKTPEETKKLMEYFGNPLSAFVQDVLKEEPGARISKDDMYEIYSAWAKENNRPRKSKAQLGRSLGTYAKYINAKHSSKERYWENVKINDTYDTFKNSLSKWNGNIHSTIDMSFSKASFPSQEETKEILEDFE